MCVCGVYVFLYSYLMPPHLTDSNAKRVAADGHGHLAIGVADVAGTWVVGCAVYNAAGSQVFQDGALVGHDHDRSLHPRSSDFYLIASREDGAGRKFIGDIAEVRTHRHTHITSKHNSCGACLVGVGAGSGSGGG